MKRICCILLFLLGSNMLSGQKKITVPVKSESSYEKILPADMLYEFAGYPRARIYFNTGNSVMEYPVNYNLVSKALLFKDKSGRVMEFAYPDQVKYLAIGDTLWVPVNGGFGKLIYNKENVELIKFRQTECTDIRKEGAFGGVSSTAATTSISSIRGSGDKSYSLLTAGEYDFETEIMYFIKVGEKDFPATAKGFKKAFPSKKNEIEKLIKTGKLNLSQKGDLIKLINSIV